MCAGHLRRQRGKGKQNRREAGQAEATPAAEGRRKQGRETGAGGSRTGGGRRKPPAKHAEDVSGTANACGTNMESGVNEPAYDRSLSRRRRMKAASGRGIFGGFCACARDSADRRRGARRAFRRHPYFPASGDGGRRPGHPERPQDAAWHDADRPPPQRDRARPVRKNTAFSGYL